jgi:phenylpropionate dioxygenase-like ring-hydroxylating dioxygenase large terminal subunit
MAMSIETRAWIDQPTPEAVASYYRGMRRFWHPVLRQEDLPTGQPLGLELLGEPIVLAWMNGRVVAFQDLCRHFQARLSLGEIVDCDGQTCLQCSYHGWAYAADGAVRRIPQLEPGREIPVDARVPAYKVALKHDLIWVCLDENPVFSIPDFSELADEDFHAGPLRVYPPWQASAPRIIMGALDDTHFPWVHTGILGERSAPQAPDHKVWRDGQDLKVSYTIDQPRNLSTGAHDQAAQTDQITYTNTVSMPGVIRLVKTGLNEQVYVIWLATCPNRYNKTTTFWRIARNYDRDPVKDADYEQFEDHVRAQDKVIVESQRPWLLPPFWTKIELPLRPADLPLIEYQKWLQELEIAIEV